MNLPLSHIGANRVAPLSGCPDCGMPGTHRCIARIAPGTIYVVSGTHRIFGSYCSDWFRNPRTARRFAEQMTKYWMDIEIVEEIDNRLNSILSPF